MRSKPDDTSKGMNAVLLHQSHENRIPVGHFVDSGSIEKMEAEGQKQLVESASLPIKINNHGADKERDHQAMVRWGIVFGKPEKGEKLFVQATLPANWKKVPTDHSMWSHVVDDKGRERISIFYKAAFYDREAFMNVQPRYANVFASDDKEYAGLDTFNGAPIHRLENKYADERVTVFASTDKQTGEVLAIFTGDHGTASDAARAFMKERFGEDWSSPEHWTE